MEKKFTKGNWNISDDTSECYLVKSDDGGLIAFVYDGDIDDEAIHMDVVQANAKLIAAAPDMLEALTNILKIVEDSEGVAGYHLNGDTAKWDEFDEVTNAIKTINKATE